ncbi:hypothetical protein E2C01_027680 [Portunus trituberculatus]|uniref:Uncharacterized protein n=1 Tax=Portunus trituberculatus TaxID=210409 RepID=A0A5B7EM70_PORTR|nr:hypothetical protein [Portunus trituberculatus]
MSLAKLRDKEEITQTQGTTAGRGAYRALILVTQRRPNLVKEAKLQTRAGIGGEEEARREAMEAEQSRGSGIQTLAHTTSTRQY